MGNPTLNRDTTMPHQAIQEAIQCARNNVSAIKSHIDGINKAVYSLANLGLYAGHSKEGQYQKQASKAVHEASLLSDADIDKLPIVDGYPHITNNDKAVIENVLISVVYAEEDYREALMVQELYIAAITDALVLGQTPNLELMMAESVEAANHQRCN